VAIEETSAQASYVVLVAPFNVFVCKMRYAEGNKGQVNVYACAFIYYYGNLEDRKIRDRGRW
jgi:hypothetical protein